jgi:hypothetical protein
MVSCSAYFVHSFLIRFGFGLCAGFFEGEYDLIPLYLYHIFVIFLYLQKKAKKFRNSEAEENVKIESYVASNEESHSKKKRKSSSM